MFYHRILMIMAASLVAECHEAIGQEKDSEKLRNQRLIKYKLQAVEIADVGTNAQNLGARPSDGLDGK